MAENCEKCQNICSRKKKKYVWAEGDVWGKKGKFYGGYDGFGLVRLVGLVTLVTLVTLVIRLIFIVFSVFKWFQWVWGNNLL